MVLVSPHSIMARPALIRDETIIEAAREVFLARGIRATTAEVAQRAGVSEGTIFNRFHSKVELFEAAMGSRMADPAFLAELQGRVGQGDIRENLYRLGREVEQHLRGVVPLIMMAWSNPGADGTPCGFGEPNPAPVRLLKAVGGYLEAEMRRGRLRRHDPEIVARTFLGSIHNYVFFDLVFQNRELPLPAETYLRGLVELAWAGLSPQEGR